MSCRPSREISGSVSSPALASTGSGGPPETGTFQSVLLPPLTEENTINLPSGVHAGVPPRLESNVSWRDWPPFDGTTQISPIGPLSFSKKAIKDPSGENA